MTETESKRVAFDIKPKTIMIVVAVLLTGGGGGAGVAAFDFCTESDVKKYVTEAKAVEDERHTVIDEKFEKQDVNIQKLGENIQKLGENIQSIQTTQIQEIARKEARRVTAVLKNRNKREDTYDRLLVQNLKRLKNGKNPCVNLACN